MQKKIYGLIGNPIKHSFSPAMHNAALEALGIDAEYRLFELKEDEIDSFINKTLKEENIWGFNVTIPYKQTMIKYLEGGLASGVEAIGAVNTVRREDSGKLAGFNTDWAGFSRDLAESGFNSAGKSISVLGAGGAARAVVFALREAKEIFIYDVDKAKLGSLIIDMETEEDFDASIISVGSINSLPVEGSDLLVNATPIGMREEDPCLIEAERLSTNTFVYDVIYNPAETKLLNLAKSKGLKFANGAGMLLYQGALAFQHWTHKDAPIKIMREALTNQL